MNKLKIVLFFMVAVASINVFSQDVVGKYNQEWILAPDEYRDSENDVVIVKDRKSSKKIWIKNLIPNQQFYAIVNMKDEESVIYAVPRQLVGNYQIKMGCLFYKGKSEDEDEEDEEYSVSIFLNSKSNCMGISQKDYQTEIGVDKEGVKVGGVEIHKSGKIAVGNDVKVGSDSGVKLNTKKLMSGIQYFGKKEFN